MTGDFYALAVQERRDEGQDAVVITFAVPQHLKALFAFEPGQHVTLRHGQERRSYSICAAQGEALRVGVRRVAGGRVSSWVHREAQVGRVLELMAPTGRFGAALGHSPRHVLMVAAGSGITPMMSMAQTLLARDAAVRVTLIYGNRTAASTMFKEELDDLKNRHLGRFALHTVFSREARDAPLHSGHLDADKICAFMPLVCAVDEAFVCGPFGMNEAVQTGLLRSGVPLGRIHIERFGVPDDGALPRPLGAAPASSGAACTIAIVRDGLRRDIVFEPTDDSILAAATRAGLDMPFSCRSGVCATCRCRLLEGQVDMARNFSLEPDELARGFVLSCQARPTTERVLISFDER
jgi:ring-1,2-phenylacetyl-CoA epoxidase subunit PaaE